MEKYGKNKRIIKVIKKWKWKKLKDNKGIQNKFF